MNYIEFNKTFKLFSVFSVKDIFKKYPDFDNRRLVEWQKKAYITKVRRGFYCFSEKETRETFLFYTANKIYSPSYISLESALSYYRLIPEGVFTINSVTTVNTSDFDTPIGDFMYKHIKKELFFGYNLVQDNVNTIKIASPEKAILDYFYLNKINTAADIRAMRFNEIEMREIIDKGRLTIYLKRFNSRVLNHRIKTFLKIIYA